MRRILICALVVSGLVAVGANAAVGVNVPQGANPPTTEVSRTHPLIIIQAWPGGEGTDEQAAEKLVSNWKYHLEDDIKPYVSVEIEARTVDPEKRLKQFRIMLDAAQKSGIPITLQIYDPDPQYAMPLWAVEKLLKEYSCINVVQIAEMRTSFYTDFGAELDLAVPAPLRYAIEVIKLSARYGRHVSWQLDRTRLTHIAADRLCGPVRDVMREYRDYILPQNEYLGPWHLVRQGSGMGLWIAGLCSNWGIEPQSWWWADATFISPGVFGEYPGPEGTLGMPDEFYRAMFLSGVMTGATVYANEPFWDNWNEIRSARWHDVVYPLMRRVIDEQLIPTQEQVLEKIKVAYQTEEARSITEFHGMLRDIDFEADKGYLARAAYGCQIRGLQHELIPNVSKYYFIPILPVGTRSDVLSRFDAVLKPGQFKSEEEYRTFLDSFYKSADGEGTAYILSIGNATYVLQTRENLYEEQTYSIKVPVAVRSLWAKKSEGAIQLTWLPVPKATSYRVWQRTERPQREFMWKPIRDNVTAPSIQLENQAQGEFAVTAFTTELEPVNGTVNYPDALIFSNRESRIVESARVTGGSTEGTAKPLPVLADTRPKSQDWWHVWKGVPSGKKEIAQDVLSAMERFKFAYENGDVRTLMDFYARDYQDPNGHHKEYVGVAWKWWLRRLKDPWVEMQPKEWDLSLFESMRTVRLKVYARFRGVQRWDEPYEFDAFPRTPRHTGAQVWWTWRKGDDGAWRIVATEPAFPNFGEMVWYARQPESRMSLDEFRDGPVERDYAP